MEQQEFTPIISEDEYEKFIETLKPKKISKKEEEYQKDSAKVIDLLQAAVISKNSEGVVNVKYIIEDVDNRVELENYLMNLIRKNLSNKITVNPHGFKNRKK